jgi:transcriptional regulator with PAS, ATPase and Fis domain
MVGGQAMRKDFFYRLCSDLIIVPSLARRIHEDPNELEDLLQVVIERIVGAPSAELVSKIRAQICQAPGIDYPWPGNVRELEQCVRRILLKHEYAPLQTHSRSDIGSMLRAGMRQQVLDAKTVIAGYCLMLYRQHKTIEAVARITGLDRRTAKKHITAGKQWFARNLITRGVSIWCWGRWIWGSGRHSRQRRPGSA